MGASALAAWREHHRIDAYCRELSTLYEETLQGEGPVSAAAVAA